MRPKEPRVHAQYRVDMHPAIKMLYKGTTGISGIVTAKMIEVMMLQAQEKHSKKNLTLFDL